MRRWKLFFVALFLLMPLTGAAEWKQVASISVDVTYDNYLDTYSSDSESYTISQPGEYKFEFDASATDGGDPTADTYGKFSISLDGTGIASGDSTSASSDYGSCYTGYDGFARYSSCSGSFTWSMSGGETLLLQVWGKRDEEYNAGDAQADTNIYRRPDEEPPNTTDDSDDQWHNSAQTIQLTCDDGGGSGCKNTYYCVDQSNTCNPDNQGNTVTVSEEGLNYLRYFSSDNSDDSPNESVQSTRVKIDYTDPETSDTSDDQWHNQSQQITLSCSDPSNPDASGCKTIYYCVDHDNQESCDPQSEGGSFSGDSGTLTLSEEGINHLRYQSEDNAGNIEPVNSTEVKLDYTLPDIFLQETDSGDFKEATVKCTDGLAGCRSGTEKMKVYSSEDVPESCPEDEGQYGVEQKTMKVSTDSYICGTAEDKAGNREFTSAPVEFLPKIFDSGFVYPSDQIRTFIGREINPIYRIKNVGNSSKGVEIRLDGADAEFPVGSSTDLSLRSGEEVFLDVTAKPVENTILNATVTSDSTGQSYNDSVKIVARNSGEEIRNINGLGYIQLVFIPLAATVYLFLS